MPVTHIMKYKGFGNSSCVCRPGGKHSQTLFQEIKLRHIQFVIITFLFHQFLMISHL